jgi:hypothetical protein
LAAKSGDGLALVAQDGFGRYDLHVDAGFDGRRDEADSVAKVRVTSRAGKRPRRIL